MIAINKLTSIIIITSLFSGISVTEAQTIYNWIGGNNGNFTTASNWSPVRVNSQLNDILVFNSGSAINVLNVQQQTVGQLKVTNNTNIILTPATGNAKCLSINGSNGADLLVEQGSSIEINGNDPKLGIFLKQNATAEVFGTIILRGTQAHYLNANDANSFIFKSGSILIQMNNGYAFTNTGNANVIVFDDGATMIIRNSGASNPFGLTPPSSKVVFSNNSTLSIQTSSADALSFFNRRYGNIIIEQNSNVNYSSNNIENITINNTTINNNCNFSIVNTNQNTTSVISLEGILTVNGSFSVSDNITLNFLNNLDRDIEGNGMHNLINMGGNIYGSSSTNPNNNVPTEFSVSQNYPNPFNSQTAIDINITAYLPVSIKLFDVNGRQVSEIINKEMSAGTHKVIFDAKNVSSGAYFYTVKAGSFTKSLKMIIAK